MKTRLALKMIGVVGALAILLIGPTFSASAEEGASKVPQFQEVHFPVTDTDKREVLASPAVTVEGKEYPIGYNTILRSGQMVGDGKFGQILDQNGQPVLNTDGSEHISADTDFSSLLPIGGKLFNVTHFESRPGAMYLTELEQDLATGKLTAISTQNIDFSGVGGLWVPCAGSVTPWGAHLGSEEYPTNARAIEIATTMEEIDDYPKPMARYFGLDPFDPNTTVEAFRSVFDPYLYGFPIEVRVASDGSYEVAKHYALGRVAVELAYVMPDRKTVYISDDGTNVGFFMFVADRPSDLSSGTLYAMKWSQVHPENGGFAEIEWVNLGHSTNAAIKAALDQKVKFFEMFDVAEPAEDGSCPAEFTSVNTTDGLECLRTKSGMEEVASRLETRRYAALKGATTELRKEEGITYDPDRKILYVAMSEVANGMADGGKNDKGGPNHIRLPVNKCGTVYGLGVDADLTIGSEYVAKNMYGVVNGIMKNYPEDSPYADNSCDIDGIANPDNITFIAGRDTLIIGEDTGSGHQNDAIWAFNVTTKQLTRIQTTPYGSETTSPYIYPNINGYAYLMSVIQHPYGESDEDKLKEPGDAAAYMGYIGPLPALD